MSGIDELISKSLTEVIKNNLDRDSLKKVKLRLFQKYGLSINQAIKDFSKVDETLKEVLNLDALGFEKKCLSEVINLKILKNSTVVTIKDKNLINLILTIFGDNEYRKIIEYSFKKPLLISEIIDNVGLPKTSGYRKINYLIRNGLLIGTKKEFTLKRRSVERYTTIFHKIIFEINKNQSFVKFDIPLKVINESTSLKIINQ